jgi:hypothetical protein
MSKRSMQKKVSLLQQKWDGEVEKENDIETGDWSADNLAKNREKAIKEQNPWVAYNMTCSEWYDNIVKPKLTEAQPKAA